MPYTNLPEELWDKMDSCVAAHVAAGADKREAIAVCYTALTGRKIAGATQGDPDSSYLLLSTHACCAADCARAACWTVDAGGKELYYCNAHLPTGLKTLAVHGVRFDVKADDDLVRTPPPGPIATKLAQEVGRDDVTAAMIQQEIIDPWLMATIGTPASDRLQLLVAKTFGHSYPVDLEPLVKTLHWDLLYAIGQIYNDTEAFLKSKGFQRWQRLPVYHPYLTSHAVTKQWQVGDEVRIKLNPATAWTLDPAEAAKVATFLASRSAPALVLKTFIPASCVISTALTGFGTPGTEELVLAGGEYEALVHQRFEGRVKEGSFVTIDDRVTFLGGASAGGGGSGGGAGGISFLPGTVEVATYDDVVKLMGAGLSIREFPYLIDPANQIHAMGKATIHADMTGGMAQSLKFANNGGLVLRVSREGIGITGSGVLEPAGIRRLQNLLLDLKLPTNADTYMIFDLKSNSNRMATFNGLIEARRAEDLSPLKYKMLQDSGLLSDSKLLAKLSRTKARNYLVDDPANRDWVKLLLVLESQASRADGAGGTSKADGKKDFVTLKDERIVFLGGAGEGGGASGGAGGIEFGPGGYVSNSDYQAYMNSNGVSAEALEEMGKLFRAHSAGGPAQEHGDAAIEAYWNDPTSEVGRALHLTADLEEAAAQNETAKRHHRLQEELDEIRSLAPEVITPDKYDDAYLLLRANPRSDASYGEGFYAREHAYQVEMLQRELQQPISMYRKSAPTDTNRQVLSYSLSAEGADFSPLTGGNFLVPDTSVPVLDSGHSILYGFARSYGSPGESEVVVIRTRTGEKSFVTLRDGRTIFIGGPDSGGGGGATSLTTVTGTSSAGKPFEATVGGAVDPRIVGKSRSLLLAPGGMIITAVDNEIMHADLAEAVGLHPADYDHSQRFITYPDHLYTTTTSLGSTQIGLAECFDNLQRASLRLIEGGYSPDTQMVLAVPGKGPVRLTLAEWTDGKKALAEKVGHFATIDDRVVFMGGAGAGGGGASGTSSFAKAATTGHATKVQGLGGGVCQAELISYEDDGQGVWKATDAANGHDGTNEVAAYGLSKLLGGDEVPETVFSPGPHGKPGTSQEFVADGATSLKFYLDHGSDDTKAFIDAHRDQVERIVALDFMIGNNDRHNENFLLSESRGIVAIDHGHAHWGWMYLQNNELLQWANDKGPTGIGVQPPFDFGRAKPVGSFKFSESNLRAWERITQADVERVLTAANVPKYVLHQGVPTETAVGAYNRLQYLIETGEMTW